MGVLQDVWMLLKRLRQFVVTEFWGVCRGEEVLTEGWDVGIVNRGFVQATSFARGELPGGRRGQAGSV